MQPHGHRARTGLDSPPDQEAADHVPLVSFEKRARQAGIEGNRDRVRTGGVPAEAAVVGQKRAAELVLTGRMFDGREAVQMGLASRAVRMKLDEAVSEYERRLKVLSPAALAHAKRALYSWDAAHFEKGLARAEEIYLKELIQTEDAREGIRAWMEKREAQWKGK